jgi:hypothetical protein
MPARRRIFLTCAALPAGKRPGLFDEVMEALRALDKQVIEGAGASTLFRGLLRTSPTWKMAVSKRSRADPVRR